MSTAAIPILTALALFVAAAMAWKFVARRQNALAQATPTVTPDGLQVPVNSIFRRSGTLLGGSQHNSLNPRFTIGPDAILFKVVSSQRLPYADIAHVEARPRRNGWMLLFVDRASGGVVLVDVIGEANALAALRALPDGLALTAEAALLRDGTMATATDGIRPYSGPMR